MQVSRSQRVGLVAVVALVVTMLSTGVASAASAGVVESSYENQYVQINAACAYAADLADNDPQRNHIAFTATATTIAKVAFATAAEADSTAKLPFATGVNCWLEGGSGSAGLSMVGPAVAVAGTGSFDRTASVQMCVTGTVLYTDGTSDTSPVQCRTV